MVNTLSDEIWTIHINGIVQGVGFRPFVYRVATRLNINGWVANTSDGVEIVAKSSSSILERFCDALASEAPPMSYIDAVSIKKQASHSVQAGFSIKYSTHHDYINTWVPPDGYVCTDCLKEMKDPRNRRYRYPFINCTNCGPRFSIIRGMPYDRPQTTMSTFTMCPLCAAEYSDPSDRRYHAQPTCCPTCGPSLTVIDSAGNVITDEPIEFAINAILSGKIVAVKSIGGFHLAACPYDETAVTLLRTRKRRKKKPFAVMVSSLSEAHKHAQLTPAEIEFLESSARPIVLCTRRPDQIVSSVAPDTPFIGLMLPSAPVHHLLLASPDLPALIMTSGNVSGKPMCYTNDDALSDLKDIADYFLVHNRDIAVRVDDSILRLTYDSTTGASFTTFIRRARGYAPYTRKASIHSTPILALGAELKTTVTISNGNDLILGQYIGDLKDRDNIDAQSKCVDFLQKVNKIEPTVLAVDLHPLFQTGRMITEHAAVRTISVQHHHAHMASCMAENGLDDVTLGIIFDGTGYGLDGTIWGSEWLVGDYNSCQRIAHIRPIKLLGSDKAIQEPFRIALALLLDSFDHIPTYQHLFPPHRLAPDKLSILIKMWQGNIHSPSSTGMGRLFDGVSSLLGLCDIAEYEAEGPAALEGVLKRDFHIIPAYPWSFSDRNNSQNLEIDYRAMVREIFAELHEGRSVEHISRRFHSTIVEFATVTTKQIAIHHNFKHIVLSGGVFQNEFLLSNISKELKSAGFDVFCHRTIPSNDGGISFGQMFVAQSSMK